MSIETYAPPQNPMDRLESIVRRSEERMIEMGTDLGQRMARLETKVDEISKRLQRHEEEHEETADRSLRIWVAIGSALILASFGLLAHFW